MAKTAKKSVKAVRKSKVPSAGRKKSVEKRGTKASERLSAATNSLQTAAARVRKAQQKKQRAGRDAGKDKPRGYEPGGGNVPPILG